MLGIFPSDGVRLRFNACFRIELMVQGEGPREWVYSVVFPEAFARAPRIFLAFRLLDVLNMKKEQDFRVACESRFISPNSFSVVISTWNDSQIWSAEVTWIAIDPNIMTLPGTLRRYQPFFVRI